MDRRAAAKIGGMDRQTLRDWVHRFNATGPEGLIDNWTEGPKPRLSAGQLAEFATIVETGPDREKDGVVRWRRVDLRRIIAVRFGVDFHERYVGKLAAVVAAAIAGYGIAQLPYHVAEASVRDGRLRRVLGDYTTPVGGLYAVYPSSRHVSPLVKAFIELAAERLAATGTGEDDKAVAVFNQSFG